MTLPRGQRLLLGVQLWAGRSLFPVLGGMAVLAMRLGMGYRVPNLGQVRRRVRELVGGKRTPLLVCANHLTMIDSAIVEWTLASNWTYFFRFWMLPWNMPEKRNYAHNPFLRLICYLMKCVPVVRGAAPEQTKRTMDKLRYLLKKNESLFIFPEGKRSRTGRIDKDDFSYGVGRLVQSVADARVLCIYQRGQGQRASSGLPRRGERFYTDVALIQPRSTSKGLRAARDISAQVIDTLYDMEQKYFNRALHRQ